MNLTKKQINEWSKEFAHVSKSYIRAYASDYKTERGYYNHLKAKNEEDEREHNLPLPIHIEIEVNWNRSRTWGWNPSVEMRWEDANGEWHYDSHAGGASGCGYDKHSAAVASALNKHFKNLLYSVRNKRTKNKPYGISYYEGSFPYFEGGVGMECYPRIFNWLGYSMEHVANAKTYDKWVIIEKKHKRKLDKAK
jgi:hypothetical protein